MDKKHLTIKDIARLAGTSHATVSRVLAHTDYPVSNALRERVLKVARECNYTPNLAGRLLKQTFTPDVGVMIPDYINPYYTTVISTLEEKLDGTDISLLIESTHRNPQKEKRVLEHLLTKRVQAIVVLDSIRDHKAYDIVREKGTKLILLNDDPQNIRDAIHISVDHQYSAEIAVDHLCKLGHKKIACISSPLSESNYNCLAYIESIRNALQKRDIILEKKYIFTPNEKQFFANPYELGRRMASRMIAEAPEITAVIAANDMLAMGVMAQLTESGIDVPGQISVIGRDDIMMASIVTPSLTTLHEAYTEFSSVIAAILRGDMEEGENGTHIVLCSRLVVRSSTSEATH